MKKDKSFYGWLFVCVTLAVLLAVSVYLGVSGWYFKVENNLESDIVLGENVQIDISKNEAEGVAFSFSGSYLAGEKLPQNISVKNIDEERGIYLRAKVFVFSENATDSQVDIIENVNWQRENDGYYYLTQILPTSGKVSLCSYVVIGEESKFDGEKSYIFQVIVEALGEDENVEELWGRQVVTNV